MKINIKKFSSCLTTLCTLQSSPWPSIVIQKSGRDWTPLVIFMLRSSHSRAGPLSSESLRSTLLYLPSFIITLLYTSHSSQITSWAPALTWLALVIFSTFSPCVCVIDTNDCSQCYNSYCCYRSYKFFTNKFYTVISFSWTFFYWSLITIKYLGSLSIYILPRSV